MVMDWEDMMIVIVVMGIFSIKVPKLLKVTCYTYNMSLWPLFSACD